MIEMTGTASLVISKSTKLPFDDASAMFDEANLEEFYLVGRTMDGSLHKFKVLDHFINWEEPEEIEAQKSTMQLVAE